MSKKELIELLEQLLGPLSTQVLNQITKFVKQGLTHKDIARAVYFMFDVQGRDKTTVSTYGIGLVPHVVDQANAYYEAIRKQQERQVEQVQELTEIESRLVSPQERVKRKKEIDISGL